MRYTPERIGEAVKQARNDLDVTQQSLALTAGTGLRFIIDLEKGKPTCQIGKVLAVLNTLGFTLTLTPPAAAHPKDITADAEDLGGR